MAWHQPGFVVITDPLFETFFWLDATPVGAILISVEPAHSVK
jgi:hypothetical protein